MNNEFSDFKNEGFSAIIDRISLFDYIQLMKMTQKDKTIEISQKNYYGLIELTEGKITYAESSTKKLGMDALFELMLLNHGNFRELKKKDKFTPNIQDNGSILLKVAEYMDKLKASESKADKVIERKSIEEEISKKLINNLNNDKVLLNWGEPRKGLLYIAVIEASGRSVSEAYFNEEDSEEIFLPNLSFSALLKDSIKMFNISKLGSFEEFILESSSHYILIKAIKSDFFVQIVISKKDSNIGFLKLGIKKLIPKLKKYLVF